MQLDPNPTFRKAITPWYDSNFACWGLIVAMVFVFAFAILGVSVGLSRPEYQPHVWFPLFLAFLSLFLLLKVFFRLKKRNHSN